MSQEHAGFLYMKFCCPLQHFISRNIITFQYTVVDEQYTLSVRHSCNCEKKTPLDFFLIESEQDAYAKAGFQSAKNGLKIISLYLTGLIMVWRIYVAHKMCPLKQHNIGCGIE